MIETTGFKWALTKLHNDSKLVSVTVNGISLNEDNSAVNGSIKIMVSFLGDKNNCF